MATSGKRVKEAKPRYPVKRRAKTSKSSASEIVLRWAEIETTTQPIVLKREGKSVAVVIKYADYQRLEKAQVKSRQLSNTPHWESQIAAMAADVEVQNALRQIEEEFALTGSDGLQGLS